MQLKIPSLQNKSPPHSKKGSKSAIGPFKSIKPVEQLPLGKTEENPYSVYFKGGADQPPLLTERVPHQKVSHLEDVITTPRLGTDAKGTSSVISTTGPRKSKRLGSEVRSLDRKLNLHDLRGDSDLKLRVLADLEVTGNGFEETLGQPTPHHAGLNPAGNRRKLFLQEFEELVGSKDEVDHRLPDSLFNADESPHILAGDIPESPEPDMAKEANESQKMNFFKQTRDQEPKKKQPTQRLRSPVIQKNTNRSFKEKKPSLGAPSQVKPIMTTSRHHNSLKMNFHMAAANSSALRRNKSPAAAANKAFLSSSALDQTGNNCSLNSGKPFPSQVAQPNKEPKPKSKAHSRTKSQHELLTT